MLAFHSDPAIKAEYLARVAAHEAADEIIHGNYWENGKGCAIGCTIHSSNHGVFETELGIPRMLARLEDCLFEGQRNGDSKTFPRRFLEAITPGADLSCVGWKFVHWVLTEELTGRNDPLVAKQIKACADVLWPLANGQPCDRKAADRAVQAIATASLYIVCAATLTDACDAAHAALTDTFHAVAAAAADAAADAAATAADAVYARSQCFSRMAEKLIELLREA